MSYEIRCSPRLRGRATSSPSLTLPSGARAGKLAVSLFSRGEIVALRSLPSWQLPVLALGIRVTQTVAMALRDFFNERGFGFYRSSCWYRHESVTKPLLGSCGGQTGVVPPLRHSKCKECPVKNAAQGGKRDLEEWCVLKI